MDGKVNRKRLTLEEFIDRGNKCHNNKYNYSKATLVDTSSTVIVICPEHGEFKVNAKRHYSESSGCPSCTNYIKNDHNKFIERARLIHGDKYDYSKSIYVASSKKLKIICPLHGEFEVTPSLHYGPRKVGCTACSGKRKLTNSDFIERSKAIHGDIYQYENTRYEASNKKVTIICPTHGDFSIRASDHIGGPKRGCIECKKLNSSSTYNGVMTTGKFIELSKKVHGNKYIYDKSAYITAKKKITITCPEHGDFSMLPSSHYSRNQGCSACGGRAGINTEGFIEKSVLLFKDRFDYSKTHYVNAKSKVTLICKEHGEFQVQPNNHLAGNGGCMYCSGRGDIDNENLIARLKASLGEQHDYSKVDYKGRNEQVTVICPTHGEFSGFPQVLIKNQGCHKCNEYTKEDFVKKALLVHEAQYDYSNTVYISSRIKLEINCPRHGFFEQDATSHLKGKGCPTCGVEKNILANRDPDDFCLLYYLKLEYKGHFFWKIGITTRDVEQRYHLLHRDNVTIIDTQILETTISKAINAENNFIREYKEYLEYRGHILKHAKGGTETFSIDVLLSNSKELSDFL